MKVSIYRVMTAPLSMAFFRHVSRSSSVRTISRKQSNIYIRMCLVSKLYSKARSDMRLSTWRYSLILRSLSNASPSSDITSLNVML